MTFFAGDSIGGRLSARELQRNASNKKGETEILKRNPKPHAVKNISEGNNQRSLGSTQKVKKMPKRTRVPPSDEAHCVSATI